MPSNDIITRFVDDLVERVLSSIGEDNVLSVFVGGSVAGGEEMYCDAGDMVEIYSDVDLYVVVGESVDLGEARRGGRVGAAEIPLVGPGYRFHRGPDIGVYTFDDLSAQPARPGTVGLDRQHRMVYGDPEMPARAAERIGERIAAPEALYLLENRLYELASLQNESRGDGKSDGYYAFVICKTVLDAVTASLVVRGRYDHRRSERLRSLTSLAATDGADEAWTAEALELARRWSERLDGLPSPEWTAGIDLDAEADAAVSLVLDRWKKTAPSCVNGNPDDWCDLVLRRCRTGDYLGNFRQFRAMSTRCGFKRRGAIAAGVHLARYSSIDALRLTALIDYLSRRASIQPDVGRLMSAMGPFLDRLTRDCGFSTGTLNERVYDMYRVVQ
jgi:hypothetical protein